MERAMQPSTSANEPLSAAEVVSAVLCRGNPQSCFLKNIRAIPSHTSAPMIQLQLKYDSEKKRSQELEYLVDEYKAKEHADAEAIRPAEHMNRIVKEQERFRVCQASCNALLKQMLVEFGP